MVYKTGKKKKKFNSVFGRFRYSIRCWVGDTWLLKWALIYNYGKSCFSEDLGKILKQHVSGGLQIQGSYLYVKNKHKALREESRQNKPWLHLTYASNSQL